VDVSLDIDLPDPDTFAPERAAHILAIVQETLANIIRHAKARHVTISARCMDDRFMLGIEDDGIGISPRVVEGHGLRNMRDRASLLNGQLEVRRLEKGTSVVLDIPWKMEP
jgi:signal transduction histidine kinase